MSDTPETDRIERRWRDYALLSFDDVFDFASRLERERDGLKEQLDTAMMLIRLQKRRAQQTNEIP